MSAINLQTQHNFFSPNKILFGNGTARSIGQETRQLGGKKVLIVTDPGVVKAGLLEQIKESLNSAGISFVLFDRVEPEPPSKVVDEGTALGKMEKCDLVVGIGGGSSLDVAKGVSVMITNEGSILSVCGPDRIPKKGVGFILIPTTSGTGSEATRALVVTDYTDPKMTRKNTALSSYLLPDLAIVDPLLTVTVPPRITADTGIDALAHAMEAYVSVNATPFSDILAEKAIGWIGEYLPIAWAKGSNLEARYFMAFSSTLAGMAFASGGLGAIHALAHTLGAEYHLAHGPSICAILLPVMKYNLSGNPKKYGRIAALMGKNTAGLSDLKAAETAVEAVRELLESMKISCRLGDYGVPKTDIPKLVQGTMRESRFFALNPRDIKEEDLHSIYEAAF